MKFYALCHPGSLALWTPKLLPWLAVLSLLLAFSAAYADLPEQPLRKDGLVIYYGVLPAKLMAPGDLAVGDTHMSPSGTRGVATHHVVIALFDEATGKRLPDATVRASVQPLGGATEEKTLEPMEIAGTVTFGNFFRMDADMPYAIHLRIRRSGGASSEVEVTLPYHHPSR
ncbi:hypothetical protein [Metapseudomonas boanensis]|uniref:DUF4426 domain-containing protein n=1 Tax=Metapseudomonas boanensis TaxID=2822138 RepID=A0ABS5XAU6_9GAMM|nr:hypothetical protein [Pseudomonas boanensis]MBT8764809.1 hypothetical protein [Pseudomonas boanensis]